jgi:GTP-binding protein
VILVNKWDLVEKETMSTRDYEETENRTFLQKTTFKSIRSNRKVYESRQQRIATSKFNEYMLKVIEAYPPPATKKCEIKIIVCSCQLKHHSLCFNMPQYVKEPYKRYLENKIRDNWDFSGVPIDILEKYFYFHIYKRKFIELVITR